MTLDLDVMGRRERNAVAAIGLGEPEVVDALRSRARRDRDEDRRKADGRSNGAPPLDALTVLGRVADQHDALTSDWAASRRRGDPPPTPVDPSLVPIDQATDAASAPARAATRAAVAARRRDNQRG